MGGGRGEKGVKLQHKVSSKLLEIFIISSMCEGYWYLAEYYEEVCLVNSSSVLYLIEFNRKF